MSPSTDNQDSSVDVQTAEENDLTSAEVFPIFFGE